MPSVFTVLANVDSDILFRPAVPGVTITGISIADDAGNFYLRMVLSDGTVIRHDGDNSFATDPVTDIPFPFDGTVDSISAEVGGAVVARVTVDPPANYVEVTDATFGPQIYDFGVVMTDTRLVGDAGSLTGATLRGGGSGDSITSLGGADRVLAGGGNDTIFYVAEAAGITALRRGLVDGGAGNDTLVIRADAAPGGVVNLMATPILGIETITLEAGATLLLSASAFWGDLLSSSATMTLGADAVLRVTASHDALVDLTGLQLMAGSGAAQQLIGLDGQDDVLIARAGLAATLSGRGGADRLAGTGLADLLDGGAGADQMTGGAGSDRYIADNGGDLVIETTGGGYDTVETTVNHTLAAFVERGIAIGDNGADLTGNSLANRLTGDNGSNVIDGAGGNDVVQGGSGQDVLTGGEGRDTLSGGFGADLLRGGLGDDNLSGGAGADRFVFSDGFGRDVITDFTEGDRINLRESDLIISFADLVENHLSSVNGNAVITAGQAQVTLIGVSADSLDIRDFFF